MQFPAAIITAVILVLAQTADAQTCNGTPATITGTAGDDELVGTSGDDVIVGLAGNDRIRGGGGNDLICGGDGDDDLYGEGGDDTLLGEADDDVLVGDSQGNVGAGSDGTDSCDGGTGIDSAGMLCEVSSNLDVDIFPVTLLADDGIELSGALHVPVGDAALVGPRKVAVLISHGAMGTYKFSVPKIWRLFGPAKGYTVLALDRRDAGMDGGGGAILFEDAVTDLQPGIDLLAALGYQKVYLAGHSQGTQNAAIYPSFTVDQRVVAVGLHGTVDDGRDTAKNLLFNEFILPPGEGYPDLVTLNEQLIADGEGDVLRNYNTIFGQPLTRTPNNFMSFWGPDSLSVVVREIENLEIPALLLRAAGDGFTPDLMSQNVLAAAIAVGVDATYLELPYLDREGNAIQLTGSGANAHSFVGVEREMLAANLGWLAGKIAEAEQRSDEFRAPEDDGSGNFKPLAYAGRTPAESAEESIALDATASRDIDDGIASYFWNQTAGEPVTLDDPDSATPSFDNPDVDSMLEFELTVTDNNGATDTVPVAIAVTAPPANNFGNFQSGGSSGLGLFGLAALLLAIRRRHFG